MLRDRGARPLEGPAASQVGACPPRCPRLSGVPVGARPAAPPPKGPCRLHRRRRGAAAPSGRAAPARGDGSAGTGAVRRKGPGSGAALLGRGLRCSPALPLFPIGRHRCAVHTYKYLRIYSGIAEFPPCQLRLCSIFTAAVPIF